MKAGMTWFQAIIHAIEWRIYAVVLDFIVVYLFTGKLILSFAVSSTSAIVRTIAHAIWVKIKLRQVKGKLY